MYSLSPQGFKGAAAGILSLSKFDDEVDKVFRVSGEAFFFKHILSRRKQMDYCRFSPLLMMIYPPLNK